MNFTFVRYQALKSLNVFVLQSGRCPKHFPVPNFRVSTCQKISKEKSMQTWISISAQIVWTRLVTRTNKKVLLRERKRHTAHRVVSTLSVVLTGTPPHPDLAGGGYPSWVPPPAGYPLSWPGWGVPYLGTPPTGYPLAGYSPGIIPPQQGTPPAGYPPPPAGPGRVPPQVSAHGILGNVAKHYGIWVPPLGVCPMAFWVMLQSIMGYGHPPPPPVNRQMGGQTRVKTLPSRRTTYAGGMKCFILYDS